MRQNIEDALGWGLWIQMALDFGSTACGLNYVYLNTSIYLQHNSQRQPITQSSNVNESSSEVMVYLLELGIREARTLGGKVRTGAVHC